MKTFMTDTIDSTTFGLLRVLRVRATEKSIANADRWHARFLWKPISLKSYAQEEEHEFDKDDIGFFEPTPYYIDSYELICDTEQLSDAPLTQPPASPYVIVLYERIIDQQHPGMEALNWLQKVCEEHIATISCCWPVIDKCGYGSLRFLPGNKKRLAEARELIDKHTSMLGHALQQADIQAESILNHDPRFPDKEPHAL